MCAASLLTMPVGNDIVSGIMRLTKIRLKRNLSQRALAAKAHMSQAYLCRIETGTVDPSLSTLKRLAEALGVSVSELVKEPRT
jgi:transcriptional regulator with XRE-family HTH domain